MEEGLTSTSSSNDLPTIEDDDEIIVNYDESLPLQNLPAALAEKNPEELPPPLPMMPPPIEEETPVLNVLLIGTTGSGKSSFGNILLTKKTATSIESYFTTSKDNLPCTKKVETKVKMLDDLGGKSFPVRVIDTPGANENPLKDLEIMGEIIRIFRELQVLSACILCFQFESKIDTQYIRTIKYYRNLLPTLFESKNLLLVFTKFLSSERDMERRLQEGIDDDSVIENCLESVIQHAKLKFLPKHFLIDSKPLNDDFAVNMKKRCDIVNYILSLSPIELKHCIVAKPPALIAKNEEEVAKLDKEIDDFRNCTKSTESENEYLEKIQKNKIETTTIEVVLGDLQKRKMSMDTDDLIQLGKWQSKIKWSLKPSPRIEKFCIESEWPICICKPWSNGDVYWNTIHQTEHKVVGQVEGQLWQGLDCSITAYGLKNQRFAEEIKLANDEIKKYQDKREHLQQELKQLQAGSLEFNAQATAFRKFIEEREERKQRLLSRTTTVEGFLNDEQFI